MARTRERFMAQHLGMPGGSGGFVGVDVFLVISGFLITGYIVERVTRGQGERGTGARGDFRFGEFYARRVRRLLPAALVTIVLTVAAAAVFLPAQLARATAEDGVASALYGANVFWTWEWWNAIWSERRAFGHFWSLGLEEQFYLVWPLLLVAVFAVARKSRIALTVAMALVLVASLATSVAVSPTDPIAAYYLLHTRAWEFALGGLVWMALASPRVREWRPPGAALLPPAGLLLIAAGFVFCRDLVFPGWSALLPTMGAAAVIVGGALRADAWGTRVLSLRPAVWLGTISYSLYLVHLPMIVVPELAMGEAPPGLVRLAIGAAAVPVAWAMWRRVEQPFRVPRTRDRHTPYRRLKQKAPDPRLYASVSCTPNPSSQRRLRRPLSIRVRSLAPRSELGSSAQQNLTRG